MAVHLRQNLLELNKDVTTSGTPERVSATDLWVTSAMIIRKNTNVGVNVYIGFSSATADKTSGNSAVIQAQDVYDIKADLDRNMQQEFNLNDIWIDVDTNGDGIVVQYIQAQGNS